MLCSRILENGRSTGHITEHDSAPFRQGWTSVKDARSNNFSPLTWWHWLLKPLWHTLKKYTFSAKSFFVKYMNFLRKSTVLKVPVAGTWLKSPSKDRTLLLCNYPSQLFCSHCILLPEYKRSILSSAQAVCCSCFWSLGGKLLLGQFLLEGSAFLF